LPLLVVGHRSDRTEKATECQKGWRKGAWRRAQLGSMTSFAQ
jgi:hypothetical protein